MKVKELIEKLQTVNPEIDVLIEEYNEYCGNILQEVKKTEVINWSYYKKADTIPTGSYKNQDSLWKLEGWEKEEYVIKPIFYLTNQE